MNSRWFDILQYIYGHAENNTELIPQLDTINKKEIMQLYNMLRAEEDFSSPVTCDSPSLL